MKKTLEELVTFRFKAAVYQDKNKNERSKVTFALQKLSQKYEKKQGHGVIQAVNFMWNYFNCIPIKHKSSKLSCDY